MISQCNVCNAVFSQTQSVTPNYPQLSYKDKTTYGCSLCKTHWWKKYDFYKWNHLKDHEGYGGEPKWKELTNWRKVWREE